VLPVDDGLQVLTIFDRFIVERALRWCLAGGEREEQGDVGANKRVKVFILVDDTSLHFEVVANRLYTFRVTSGEVNLESGMFVRDRKVAQLSQSLKVFQDCRQFLDCSREVHREDIEETLVVERILLLRETSEALDSLQWSKSGDGGVDVEADVRAGGSLGNLVQGTVDLILQSRNSLEALLSIVWVDAVKLGLLTADQECSHSLRDVVDDLSRSRRTMAEVSSTSGTTRSPTITSCSSAESASSQVRSECRSKRSTASLSIDKIQCATSGRTTCRT